MTRFLGTSRRFQLTINGRRAEAPGTYRAVEEALQCANALEVGFGGSAWGNDKTDASRIAQRLHCGTAWVNQHGTLNPFAPFGGVKRSGIGAEFGVEGLKEYTTLQTINIAA